MHQTLNRESLRSGTRIALRSNGRLILSWKEQIEPATVPYQLAD